MEIKVIALINRINKRSLSRTVFSGSGFDKLTVKDFYNRIINKGLLEEEISLWVETEKKSGKPIEVCLKNQSQSETTLSQLKEQLNELTA